MSSLALIALAWSWSSAPFSATPLSDSILDSQRGGFRLPSGVDVAIAVDTQTAINGAVVLRTTFRADQGTPTVTIYVPKDGATVPSQPRETAVNGTSSPTVTYDAQRGIQVSSSGGGGPNVTVGGSADATAVPDGLRAVAPGGGTDGSAGNLVESKIGSTDVVTLSAGDLSVSHLTGGAFGSVITNAGNDRAIDTQTTLSISLSNAGPDNLGSAMFRVADVATAALQTRTN